MATSLRHVPATPRPALRAEAASFVRPPTPSWRRWIERTRASFAALGSLAALDALGYAGYATALATVAAATATALALRLGAEPGVFCPFLVAVTATALWYGIGPALVAIGASLIAAYVCFLAPLAALAFDPSALLRLTVFRLAIFATTGVLVMLLAEAERERFQRLERSRRQLRAFTADAEVGLQVVDHEGRITWADDATSRLLGYDPRELVGEPFARFHVDTALGADVAARLAAGRPVENVRARLRRKDGDAQEVLLNSNMLLGDAATPGADVIVAILPIKSAAPAVDGTKLAVAVLLERRRKAAAERHAPASQSAPSERKTS